MSAARDHLAVLVASLDAQRRHVLGILDGLDDAALRRAVLPSGWSCASVIQHLTLDVERFWFRGVVAADESVIAHHHAADEDPWSIADGVDALTVLDEYRRETERANEIIRARSVDSPPAWWPGELFGDWRMDTLGEIILHVITETACHAGHLDAARELIDGTRWLVLTD